MIQFARIERLRDRGFLRREIATITGASLSAIDRSLSARQRDECSVLEATGRRLMAKVPLWWTESSAAWRRCVWCNFCDVLKTD